MHKHKIDHDVDSMEGGENSRKMVSGTPVLRVCTRSIIDPDTPEHLVPSHGLRVCKECRDGVVWVPQTSMLVIGVPATVGQFKRVTPAVWKNWGIIGDKTFELQSKTDFVLVFTRNQNLSIQIQRARSIGLVVYNDVSDAVPNEICFQYNPNKRDFHPDELQLRNCGGSTEPSKQAFYDPIIPITKSSKEKPGAKVKSNTITPKSKTKHNVKSTTSEVTVASSKFHSLEIPASVPQTSAYSGYDTIPSGSQYAQKERKLGDVGRADTKDSFGSALGFLQHFEHGERNQSLMMGHGQERISLNNMLGIDMSPHGMNSGMQNIVPSNWSGCMTQQMEMNLSPFNANDNSDILAHTKPHLHSSNYAFDASMQNPHKEGSYSPNYHMWNINARAGGPATNSHIEFDVEGSQPVHWGKQRLELAGKTNSTWSFLLNHDEYHSPQNVAERGVSTIPMDPGIDSMKRSADFGDIVTVPGLGNFQSEESMSKRMRYSEGFASELLDKFTEECTKMIQEALLLSRRKGVIEILLVNLLNFPHKHEENTSEETSNSSHLSLLQYTSKLSACNTFDEGLLKYVLDACNFTNVCVHGLQLVPPITPEVSNKIMIWVLERLQILYSNRRISESMNPKDVLRLLTMSASEAVGMFQGYQAQQEELSNYANQHQSNPMPRDNLSNGTSKEELPNAESKDKAQDFYQDFKGDTSNEQEEHYKQSVIPFLVFYIGEEIPSLRDHAQSRGIESGTMIYIQSHKLGVRMVGCFGDEVFIPTASSQIFGDRKSVV